MGVQKHICPDRGSDSDVASIEITTDVLFVPSRLQLRSEFSDVFSMLPAGYKEPGWAPTDGEQRMLENYWHHAFNEWYAARVLDLSGCV